LSGTSIFAYDGDNLIEETNASATVVAHYLRGENIDEPLAMLRSSTTSYNQADGVGSISSLSNGSGALVQTYTFDSFGTQTASTGSLTNPFQYTGRESDSETGLYYYRARYYDPNTGRFLSEDPDRWNGSGVDFYPYAENQPTAYRDPTGRDIRVDGDPGAWGKARSRLIGDPGMAGIILGLEKSPRIYRIKILDTNCRSIGGCGAGFDDKTLTIYWDPSCIAFCPTSHCSISPTLSLGHELAHAFHFDSDSPAYFARSKHKVKDYGDAEEQLTIAGPENNAAITLHECIRNSHQGTGIKLPQ
jgi:RHS repeat-associated protein